MARRRRPEAKPAARQMPLLLLLIIAGVGSASALEQTPNEPTFPGRVGGCAREAKCEQHANLTCFGRPLPYTSTTIELVDDAENQREVDERLAYWETGLRQIPRCWPVIQPLLCSLYRPPCRNNSVHLISSKLCEHARKACSIIMPVGGVEWPHFLRCEQDIFSKACKSEVRKSETPKIRFNLTTTCPSPLVPTSDRESWYSEIEGCGVSCQQNPLISVEEQTDKSRYDAWLVLFSASCCLVVLLIYALSWRSTPTSYASRMRVYLAGCLLIVCAGYAAQFVVGRDAILCKKDGTTRKNEPSAKENLVCVANFVACYYFQNAAFAWFILACYALHSSILVLPSQGLGEREYWKSKATYFHLIAWSAPLVLTIFVVALSNIEADPTTGICSVTRQSLLSQIFLVVFPFAGAVLIGGWFLAHLMFHLDRRKNSGSSVLGEEARSSMVKAIVRLRIFLICLLIMAVVTGLCLLYEFRHLDLWRSAIREHFSCRLNPGQPSGDELNQDLYLRSCELKNKPSLTMLHVPMAIFALACLTLLVVTLNSSVAAAARRAWKKVILRQEPGVVTPAFTQVLAAVFAQDRKDQPDTAEDCGVAGDSVSQSLSASYANMFPGLGYGVAPILVSRRYSSTSDVSRQTTKWMQSMARKRKTRKERDRHRVTEKTTSTGDLGSATMPLLAQQTPQAPLQDAGSAFRRSMVQKRDLIDPPFTHGLSGEARENRLSPFRPTKPRPAPAEQATPAAIPFPAMSVPSQQAMYAALQGTALPGTAHPGLPMPIAFPPQVFPLIDPYTGFPMSAYSPYFSAYGMVAAAQPPNNFVPFPDLDNIKSPLIPLRAHETGSEASFRMIVPSDTEYDTDAYRPQTAVLRQAEKPPRTGRLSAPFKRANGFFSS